MTSLLICVILQSVFDRPRYRTALQVRKISIMRLQHMAV